ncbi:hypothetical protein VSDG_09628 [Cytospora chrysosperma]|uniref:Uncharacterized protein n=1 Tax=Cytospora chrysosperma TaxID=252740 RepID=A0A423V9Q9_CYTCH|nr:hypothetical protein VSDG_09628 [Valsa sordida]
MASTASAVSLNDLQPLASGILPTDCAAAYNATILGCTTADFASGSYCSRACRVGVEIIEGLVYSVCDDVDASRNSVLGFAQRGVLLYHACQGNDVTLPQTTSTTAAPYTTTIPIVLTTSHSYHQLDHTILNPLDDVHVLTDHITGSDSVIEHIIEHVVIDWDIPEVHDGIDINISGLYFSAHLFGNGVDPWAAGKRNLSI